jgi:hypothetical protein
MREMETEAEEHGNGGEGGERQRAANTERDIVAIGDAMRQTNQQRQQKQEQQ